MTPDERTSRRSNRRGPTLADVVARRLAQLGLMWATTPILAALVLGIAIGLFAAWILLLVLIAWIGGLLGLTSGGGPTPFVIGALVVSGLILFVPTRWAVRNLRGAERTLDATIDRLAVPTAPDAGTVLDRRPITPADLAALDARLAPRPSAGAERLPEQPDG